MNQSHRSLLAKNLFFIVVSLLSTSLTARAQIFEDLGVVKSLIGMGQRFDVGDSNRPAIRGHDAPVSVASGYIDGDDHIDVAVSNLDGTITVYFGQSGILSKVPVHLSTGAESLGELIVSDLNGDGHADIAVTAPFDGEVILFFSDGEPGSVDETRKIKLPAWRGVRNLVAGNFDGTGGLDLAVAGPIIGVRHYRNVGARGRMPRLDDFEPVDVPGSSWSLGQSEVALETVPIEGSELDQLVVKPIGEGPISIFGRDHVRSAPPYDYWRQVNTDSPVLITEIEANTADNPQDEFPDDIIELFNRSNRDVDLSTWGLTNDPNIPAKWMFPDKLVLEAGSFLEIRASGRDLRSKLTMLETNFDLVATGDFVALTEGGAEKHALSAGQNFPPQFPGVSYGLTQNGQERYFPLPSPGQINNHGVEERDLTLAEITKVRTIPADAKRHEEVTVEMQFQNPTYVEAAWLVVVHENRERSLAMSPVEEKNGWRSVHLPGGVYDPQHEWRVHGSLRGGLQRQLPVMGSEERVGSGDGALRLLATIPTTAKRSGPMAVAPLLTKIPDNQSPDLVVFDEDAREFRVHRGNAHPHRFNHIPAQDAVIQVPEGVRALEVADLDGDGYNDLAVILKEADKVVIFLNEFGQRFTRHDEIAVGRDPRDLTIANLENDRREPDLIVMNRGSKDLSVIKSIDDGVFGLEKSTVIYPVYGTVTSMVIGHYNASEDRYLDVIATNPRGEEMIVFLGSPDGTLEQFSSFRVDPLTIQMAMDDYDGDGDLDLVFSSLEAFAPTFKGISENALEDLDIGLEGDVENKGVLWAKSMDLDNDLRSTSDVIAFGYDCRIRRYRTTHTGSKTTMTLISEEESDPEEDLVLGYIDSDLFPDMVALTQDGKVVVYLTDGKSLLDWENLPDRREYALPDNTTGANKVWLGDLDGDEKPDVLAATNAGIFMLRGRGDGEFVEPAVRLVDTGKDPLSSLVVADFDDNGTKEIAVGCDKRACIIFLTQSDDGSYKRERTLDVPSASLLAVDDLDGDSLPDLIGGGDHGFWTALSGTEPERSGQPGSEPLPEMPNTLDIGSVSVEAFVPASPIRFSYEKPEGALPPIRVSVIYERLDMSEEEPESEPERVILFDNGLNGDGGRLDGRWSGKLEGLPEGAEIRYYWEIVNVIGDTMTLPPDVESFSTDDATIAFFTVSAGTVDTLQFNEIASREGDSIEIRNTSNEDRSLDGLRISETFPAEPGRTFTFPNGLVLGAGQVLVIRADGENTDPFSAPFRLNGNGGSLFLTAQGIRGGRSVIDYVRFPAMNDEQAYVRANPRLWRISDGRSPGEPNPEEPYNGTAYTPDHQPVDVVILKTSAGVLYRAIGSDGTTISEFTGDGLWRVVEGARSVEGNPPTRPEIGNVSVESYTRATAEIGVALSTTGGASTTLTVFWGSRDGGQDAAAWPNFLALENQSESGAFQFLLSDLDEGSSNFFQVRAHNATGATWMKQSQRFETLPESAPKVDIDGQQSNKITTRTADISIFVEEAGDSNIQSVRVYWGRVDSGSNPDGWKNATLAELESASGSWLATIKTTAVTEVTPGETYYYRIEVINENGMSAWAPTTGRFTTWSMERAISEFLVISEFMYNPPAMDEGFEKWHYEYIELRNLSETMALDLSKLILTVHEPRDPSPIFEFRDFDLSSNDVLLPPGEIAVLVADEVAFREKYGNEPTVIGTWWSPDFDTFIHGDPKGMSNNGGVLSLRHRDSDESFFSVAYSDREPWPILADGEGYSLTLIVPTGDPNDPGNWRPEAIGSPGFFSNSDNIEKALDSLWVSEISIRGTEYVELVYLGEEPIAVKNLVIREGIEFDFSESDIQRLDPGQRILVVKNAGNFSNDVQSQIAGEFEKQLGPSDHIIVTMGGIVLHDFRLGEPGWPADDFDVIEVVNPALRPGLSDGRFWSGSATATPGEMSEIQKLARNFVITEFRAGPGDLEYLEFQNIGAAELNLTEVTLTGGEIRYQFPEGALMKPGEYYVLYRIGKRDFLVADQPFALWDEIKAGEFAGRLGSTGPNPLQLLINGRIATEFTYGAGLRGWPEAKTILFGEEAFDSPFALRDPKGTRPDQYGRGEHWEQPATTPSPGGAWISFGNWSSRFFNEIQKGDNTISGRAADPDGDLYSNRDEFAFDGNPTQVDENLQYHTLDGNQHAVEFRTPMFPLKLAFTVESLGTDDEWTPTRDYSVDRRADGDSMVWIKYRSTRSIDEEKGFRVVAGLPPFAQWMEDSELEDPGADPDHDGLVNFMEWATSGNPRQPGDRGVEFFFEDINGLLYPAFRFDAPAGVSAQMECSDDLESWEPCPDTVDERIDHPKGTIGYTFRHPMAINPPPLLRARSSRYYRIRLEEDLTP